MMISLLKNILRSNQYFYNAAKRVYNFWLPEETDITHFIDTFSSSSDDIFYVQIGANDATQGDNLSEIRDRDRWHGILIEPQKNVFENFLSPKFSDDDRFVLENIAIADSTETKTLYKISFSEDRWATGLASFSKEVLTKVVDSGYVDMWAKATQTEVPESKDDYISTELVSSITLHELLKKHAVKNVDILQIDTEGYDFEILKTIDYSQIRPRIIVYEHKHLSTNILKESLKLLRKNNYQLYRDKTDILAIDKLNKS